MEKTYFNLLSPVTHTSRSDTTMLHSAFEVSDDSMADGSRYSYEPGDIVICRRLLPQLWKQQVQTGGHDFILLHRRSGALLRRISRHDCIAGTMTLHPLNPRYRDCDIDIGDVDDAYHVIKVERTKA